MDATGEETAPGEVPRQAYCATHAERPAQGTCARCGDHVCGECTARHSDAGPLCTRCAALKPSISALALTKALSILFLVNVAMEGVTLLALLIEMSLFSSLDYDEATFTSYVAIIGVVGIAELGVLITTMVCFCVWMNRSNRIARELGGKLQHGPHGWAWFLVPCANLFVPYRAVNELYASVKDGVVPSVFPLWWGAWIVSNIIAYFETRMSFSDEIGISPGTMVIALVSSAATIAAAFLARQVVLMVNEAQEGRAGGPGVPAER